MQFAPQKRTYNCVMEVKRTPEEARRAARSIAASLRIEGRTLTPEGFELGVAVLEGKMDVNEAIAAAKRQVKITKRVQ